MSALDGTDRAHLLPGSGHSLTGGVAAPFSMLSFWAAIALPVFYLPLLAAGIDSVTGLALFLGLFGLHVLALVGGRPYASFSEP